MRGSRLAAAAWLISLCAAADSAAIWLDVPFVGQAKNGCGPAAAAMVFDYWRLHGYAARDLPDDAAVARDLAWAGAAGLPARELAAYFETHGFRAFTVAAEWDDLA